MIINFLSKFWQESNSANWFYLKQLLSESYWYIFLQTSLVICKFRVDTFLTRNRILFMFYRRRNFYWFKFHRWKHTWRANSWRYEKNLQFGNLYCLFMISSRASSVNTSREEPKHSDVLLFSLLYVLCIIFLSIKNHSMYGSTLLFLWW